MKAEELKPFTESAPPGLAIDRGQFDGIRPVTIEELDARAIQVLGQIVPGKAKHWRVCNRQQRPVRCIDTHMVYTSCRAASEAMGLSYAQIANAAYRHRTAGGLRWEFIGGGMKYKKRAKRLTGESK